jgi:flagellar hook-associated protein 1 FlgK
MFSIARSALLTHQQVIQTISHNIANAETPGYSRQEAILSANTPVRMSYGIVGTGVHVDSIARKRDTLLDDTFRQASGQSGEANSRSTSLGAIEDIFGEPSDVGLTNTLDEYWNSWSDLGASPSNQSARAVVQQRGVQVTKLLNSYDAGLTQQRTSTFDRMAGVVDVVNQTAARVAELNGQIALTENAGSDSGDLADSRDLLLDKLASMAGTRSSKQADGTVTVLIGTSALVSGNTSNGLRLDLVLPNPPPSTPSPDTPVRLLLGNSPDAMRAFGGELKAMTDVINTDIPQVRSRLDALASSLVRAINGAHTSGYTFSGTLPATPAGNFFDPGSASVPVSAATIKLSATVAADSSKIAASSDPNAPLGNGVATMMAAFRNDETTVSYNHNGVTETGSFLGFFRTTATRLGLDVNTASDQASVSSVLTDQADTRRQSVSGVNTDEELIQMLRVQQAYTAATKLIKTADEMLQTLLSLV